MDKQPEKKLSLLITDQSLKKLEKKLEALTEAYTQSTKDGEQTKACFDKRLSACWKAFQDFKQGEDYQSRKINAIQKEVVEISIRFDEFSHHNSLIIIATTFFFTLAGVVLGWLFFH